MQENVNMKITTCDRCGKEIPYLPPYMNALKQGIVPPRVIMTVWDTLSQTTKEVDLCDACQQLVYEYIYCYKDSEPSKASD